MARKQKRVIPQNKNSRVISRIDRTGKFRTETSRRDNGSLDLAITTNLSTGATRLFIDEMGREGNQAYPTIDLNGHQARTLFLALQKHYEQTGLPSLNVF